MDFYFRMTVAREIAPQMLEILGKYNFEALDISGEFDEFINQKPREIYRGLEREELHLQKTQENLQTKSVDLSVHLIDLRILYDYHSWGKKKNDLQHKILQTKNIFAFEAWMPERDFDHLGKWIADIFVGEVAFEKASLEEGEEAPVFIQNKTGLASYEPITEMFGTPGNKDIDPTSYLAPFFFVFFGLCLSDVGYGGILTLVAAFFLLFGTFSHAAKDGIRLLLFCGIGAFLGGIFVGGYFGMTPEQAPNFLLSADYVAGIEGALPFKGQFLDPMKGQGPINFLILAMALGVIQLLTGVFLDFVRKLKNKEYIAAFCDPLAWFYFLIALIGFAIADKVGFSKELFKNLAISGAVILILTQGRDQKNWFLKPISGVLGLYNVTGYVSDLLSYSRIMALGMATGVIGFAMNLTAGILGEMMPHPILGFIVAVAFLLFGHSLNFALSLLGAFVHSGRLQFIEFFGKFFEGGGRKFKPFAREKKYLFFRTP
jgi:V/A-type H+-transporting ATPase subunit I